VKGGYWHTGDRRLWANCGQWALSWYGYTFRFFYTMQTNGYCVEQSAHYHCFI